MANDGSVVFGTEVDESGLKKGLGNIGKLAGSGLKAVGGIVGGALAAATTGLVAFGKASIQTTKEFDSSMSQIAATLGITSDDIANNINGAGDTFDALREKAMEMGAATNFTAQQAADGLNILAMSGYDANDSIAMIEDVLHLAAAGSMELSTAAGYVSGSMKGFADNTKTAQYYADLMAKGATLANTNVSQLGDALSGAAATSASYGQTAESATIALLRLAEQGTVGSAAATELAAAMKDIYTPTAQAAEALEAIGVKAYDSSGKQRDFNDVINDLDASLNALGTDGLPLYTEAEKAAIKQTVFGIQGLKAYNKMVVTSTDTQKKWAKQLKSSTGEASKQYATMTDNLQGDLDILGSAFDGLKVAVGDKLMPTFRRFVQFGSDGLTKLTTAFKNNGIEGFAEEFGSILGKALDKLTKYIPTFASAAGKLALSLIDSVGSTLTKNFDKLLRTALNTAKDLALGLAQRIPDIFGNIGSIIGDVISNIPNILELGLKIIKGLTIGILEGIPKLLQGVWSGIEGLFSEPISEDVRLAREHLDELKEELAGVGKETEEMINGFKTADENARLAEHWLEVFDQLKDKTNLTAGEQEYLNKAVEKLNELIPDLGLQIDEETGKWSLNTEEIRKNIEAIKLRAKADVYYKKISAEMERLVEKEEELADAQVTLNELMTNRDSIKTSYDLTNALIKEAEQINKNGHNVVTQWNEGSAALREYAESCGVTSEKFSGWDQIIGWLWEDEFALESQLKNANKQVETQGEIVSTVEGIIEGINEEIDNFANKAGELEEEAAKVGEAIGDGVIKGMNRKKALVSNTAGDLARLAIKAMKNVAQIASPSKRARKEVGEQIGEGEVLGLEDKIPDVKKASKKLIGAVDLDISDADNVFERLRGGVKSEQMWLQASESVQGATRKAEDDGEHKPEYVETVIMIDGKETARVISPYVSKEIAWSTKK